MNSTNGQQTDDCSRSLSFDGFDWRRYNFCRCLSKRRRMQTGTSSQGTTVSAIDRRRSPRHRLSTPITVWLPDQTGAAAMTIEISESGLSVCTGVVLVVGEKVDLEPIGGGRVSAIVRRKLGKVYGVEFFSLPGERAQAIRRLCGRLPLFNGGTTGI